MHNKRIRIYGIDLDERWHECCMGYVVWRKPEHEMFSGDDERYLLCAAVAAAVVFWFLLCVLQQVVGPVCVVFCVS